jgi:hypothetical protein
LFCATSRADAADLDAAIPGHAGLTYFDLMKRVVTDLAPGGKDGAVGHAVVPFQHIDGKDAKGDPPETITLQSVDVMNIPGDDSRIILLADLGPSDGFVANAQLLALFALAPAPQLLDVVEVGTDRFTGLSDAEPVMLAPGAPLVLVYNSHSNSDQSYQSVKMLFIRGDRFRSIGSVFTFDERFCAYEQKQEPSFATLDGPGPYRAVRVSVLERVTVTGDDCGEEKAPRPHLAAYQAIYRWDARRQRFETRSTQLDRLAKQNEKRF